MLVSAVLTSEEDERVKKWWGYSPAAPVLSQLCVKQVWAGIEVISAWKWNRVLLLLQSLDDLGTTRGECLGRTWWSSPLDWTTYLYYFTSGCTLLVHDHMSFWNVLQSHDLVTWYDYINSHAIYIFSSLYDLIFVIKCLNAWETFSFLGLS